MRMNRVILAVSAVALLAGCGSRSSAVSGAQAGILRGTTTAGGTHTIPSNTSIQSANSALIGSFTYGRTACLDSSGGSIPQPYMQASVSEKIVISDRAVSDSFDLGNGCTVTYQYDVAGVDSKVMVLNNMRVNVAYQGGIDPTGECSQMSSSAASSAQTYSFDYLLGYDPMLGANSLSLLSAPTGNCESNERTQDIYRKL